MCGTGLLFYLQVGIELAIFGGDFLGLTSYFDCQVLGQGQYL
jgi:hypothetical protein